MLCCGRVIDVGRQRAAFNVLASSVNINAFLLRQRHPLAGLRFCRGHRASRSSEASVNGAVETLAHAAGSRSCCNQNGIGFWRVLLDEIDGIAKFVFAALAAFGAFSATAAIFRDTVMFVI
ncbi:MAG: hypothetical protein CTY21_12430 [Methylomonas sp.]|nr:MAG: hypothetical protein CTY21_12430 [Methylomonas sp.]